MNFDRVRMGDVVCWDEETIIEKLGALSNSSLWKQEQFGCYLQVVSIRHGKSIELECVKDCGLHLTTSITRDEYEDYYDDLGTDIFVFADSFADLSKVFGPEPVVEKEDTYDFSRDNEEILRMITRGQLPMYRRRNA
jgi:hypothetical protein